MIIRFLKLSIAGILFLAGLNGFAQMAPNPGQAEGMWLPNQVAELKGEDMKKLGLKISPDSLYNPNGPSLKDAIVRLSGGSCTAGTISPNGLLITNHHCAYDEVAAISTPEKDYLTNGFWPGSLEEEIPLEGMSAGFLVRIDDVTDQFKDLTDDEANSLADKLVREAEEGGAGYQANIAEMYHGLEYYLYVYQEFTDVRLAGVPPADIGKFGYDTDNWTWPRHTGDFAILRVYANADNEPAAYADNNQPYKPKGYFPMTLNGVEENDFTMIMGYPGTTERYLTSFAVSHRVDQNFPDQIKLREIVTTNMKEAMDQSDEYRLQLAGDYASLMNYYKYFKGSATMLKRNNIIEKLQQSEAAFQSWADANPERKEMYGDILGDIEELHLAHKEAEHFFQYLIYSTLHPVAAPKGMRYSYSKLRRLDVIFTRGSEDVQKREIAGLKDELDAEYSTFIRSVDKKTFLAYLEAMYTDMSEDFRLASFGKIVNGELAFPMSEEEELTKKQKKKLKKQAKKNRKVWNAMSDVEKIMAWADTAYDRSLAGNPDRLRALLDDPDKEVVANDPILGLVKDALSVYTSQALLVLGTFEQQIGDLRKIYIKGQMEMQPERTFYPDANSTTRFAYGTVKSYDVGDSISYSHFTTTKGIIEKHDPENPDYRVPEKLLTLINSNDYGPYLDEDGSMRVCFLSTNDITGGNSGSPVLNGKGELVGVAFDSNWESMCGDIQVLPEVNRTIVADIRYVLFVIDKFGGSKHIMEELEVRKE